MDSRQTLHTLIAATIVTACAGCFRSLPPPTLRQAALAPGESYEKLCATGIKRADLTIHGDSPLSGILECKPHEAAIALFNSLKLRVRTIVISRDGKVRDEISYLSPSNDSAERLFQEINTEMTSPLEAGTSQPRYLSVQIRERLKP